MPLAVLPALVGDIEEAFNVHFDAFRDEPIMRFLYPGGVDREAHRKGTATWWNHDRTGHHFKCVDTDTGRIVGLASWDVFWKPGDGFERPAGIPWLEGEDKTRCEAVLAPIWDLRVRFFGKRRHVYLASVAVDPQHQRRGIGSLLVKSGVDMAEQLQVPVYTEASESGFGLYERMGFERVTHARLIHRAEVTGDPADVEVPLVVRMPSAAKGMSFKEWEEKGFPENYHTKAFANLLELKWTMQTAV
ncbi:hypothetical protein MCOR11_008472 [Pyricularia oryzae]|nr:hypothetical protein MCOR11_008472 [Pyricularia oryzae]